MRSGYDIDRRIHPSRAVERPLATRTSAGTVDEAGDEVRALEDDDAFQWFVNLFVAEYASEQ